MNLYVIKNGLFIRVSQNYLTIVPTGTSTIVCSPFLPWQSLFLPLTPFSPLSSVSNLDKLFTLCDAANTT